MKKIYLLLILFIVTGCSANYDLTIDNEKVIEQASITFPKSVTSEEIFKSQTKNPKPVYNDNKYFYDKKVSNDSKNFYLNYSFTHEIDKFTNSSILKNCFASNKIANDKDYISITTSDRFLCINDLDDEAYIDEVKVTINTKLKVIKNNADKIENNKYIWIFDKDNYNNKPINITLKKDNSLTSKVVKIIKNPNLWYISLGIIVLLVIAIFGYKFIKNKNINNNKF